MEILAMNYFSSTADIFRWKSPQLIIHETVLRNLKNTMKLLKYVGLLSLISSYTFLILSLKVDISETANFNLFNIAWGLGILSLILNVVYAIKAQIKNWIFSIFGVCGLI